MSYETEIRNSGSGELDVLAAWEVYAMALAGLIIYSLVSGLV